MPLNESLPDLKLPVSMKTGELPITKFEEHLSSIKVELLSCPSISDILSYIPRWVDATWNDKPHDDYTFEERMDLVIDMFNGNTLPSAMETIGLVFLISNIDLVDVTHLLRHRTMSFSAVCTADRDLRHDKCLIKPSILQSKKFWKRYVQLMRDAKQLYSDMVDTGDISLLDARTVLPRSFENHYYCRVNLKDALHYLKQRLDRQIQPESDNIVAIQMWYNICKAYPPIIDVINLKLPDAWYVRTVPTGKGSNIYMPEIPRNDVLEYKDQWFLYKKQRKDMKGGEVFIGIWEYWVDKINTLRSR